MISIARPEHLKSINDIYNQAVEDGFRTAHTEPMPLSERRYWFEDHSEEQHPVFVYEKNNTVLGWLSVSPYRSDRQALDEVVEVSYYVDYHHHGRGIASELMKHAIDFCKITNYRIMVAILVSNNLPSIELLEKFNFKEGGRIPGAIHYQNEFRDHLYMYKPLDKA